MAPAKSGKDQPTVPTSFPSTTPPVIGTDLSTWLLSASTKTEGALGKIDATLTAMQTQLNRIETKLGDVEDEVAGHGKWMHTLKAFAGVLLLLLGWLFVNAFWPWLKQKIGAP